MTAESSPTRSAPDFGVPPAGLTVEDVLITGQLAARPGMRDPEAALQAYADIAAVMAKQPADLPQKLCDVALALCGAGTAGISVLRDDVDGSEYFYWQALAGAYSSHVGGMTPREWSPCGTTLDRGTTQLCDRPARFFSYFAPFAPEIFEGLVVPFYVEGEPLGTLWIVSHDKDTHFTQWHAEVMETLAQFTAAALHLLWTRAVAGSALVSREAIDRASRLERISERIATMLGDKQSTGAVDSQRP